MRSTVLNVLCSTNLIVICFDSSISEIKSDCTLMLHRVTVLSLIFWVLTAVCVASRKRWSSSCSFISLWNFSQRTVYLQTLFDQSDCKPDWTVTKFIAEQKLNLVYEQQADVSSHLSFFLSKYGKDLRIFWIKIVERHTNFELQASARGGLEGAAYDRTVLVYWYKVLYYSQARQPRNARCFYSRDGR